jgi:hypothetical protein
MNFIKLTHKWEIVFHILVVGIDSMRVSNSWRIDKCDQKVASKEFEAFAALSGWLSGNCRLVHVFRESDIDLLEVLMSNAEIGIKYEILFV